ncbi:hypothetical protein BAE44_0019387 [Dichanthelium oligosanthes]|uniref:Uncharacterized protein n=1 Tax=Dichanthelium oligosanthes TaxID=888268 RepID=A0A1E5V3G9_9POAL|nr:hypothetical protein BAE44_0019387 [Dichanthelium oligosanthes]
MNAPDRYERFVVPEGTKKNLLSAHLLIGSRLLVTNFMLHGQIHTTSQSSPTQAYTQAIGDLDKELEHLKQAFEVCF